VGGLGKTGVDGLSKMPINIDLTVVGRFFYEQYETIMV
jgi:hypothetical protein